jgi:nitroimidazol reductase NimA-like FMN-containing flavoprotein (pyridoxamine 5'-phosphate oxidase superfamily)
LAAEAVSRVAAVAGVSATQKEFVAMSEPITTSDPRNPKAVATAWEETRRALETAELFWLTTVRADGRPHVTPLVAVWHDGVLYFTITDDGQKAANLRGNPHVILTTSGNNWKESLDVVVEGEAVRVTDHETLERVAAVWATKWDGGVWTYQVHEGHFRLYAKDGQKVLAASNLVFSVKTRKAFAYVIGRSQTRYQF